MPRHSLPARSRPRTRTSPSRSRKCPSCCNIDILIFDNAEHHAEREASRHERLRDKTRLYQGETQIFLPSPRLITIFRRASCGYTFFLPLELLTLSTAKVQVGSVAPVTFAALQEKASRPGQPSCENTLFWWGNVGKATNSAGIKASSIG